MQSRTSRLTGTAVSTHTLKLRRNVGRFCVRAGVVSSNEIKNGLTLEVNNQPFKVVEFLHVKPGKGAAFVRSKLKNCISGSVIDKTFRAGEMLTTADIKRSECQFTYVEGKNYVFMDMESFEETRVEKEDSWAKYIKEGCEVFLTYYQDKVIDVEPPQTVEMKVIQADAGVKGNTASGATHPVTLETGVVIQAPLFVKEGDMIKIDTKRDTYLSRV